VKTSEPEVETMSVVPGTVPQLVAVGDAVVDQLPELPQLYEPVWYAGGPITTEEPPLELTVVVTEPEAEAEADVGDEAGLDDVESELAHASFSSTEN
jgi:hypothetical protein